MILPIKRLLIASSVIALSFPQGGLGAERIQDNRNGAVTIKVEASAQQSLSWWDWGKGLAEMPKHFAATLLEPFIQDAPKALAALKEEERTIGKEGFFAYVFKRGWQIAASHPLDAITFGGALVLGYTNIAGYSELVPLTVGVAGGLKEGNLLYDLASNMDGKTVFDKTLKFGLYGAAICAAASLPVSYALSTPTLGVQFQIYQPFKSWVFSDAAGLSNGNVVVAWADNHNMKDRNIRLRIFDPTNGTAVTEEFRMNASNTDSVIQPSVASCGNNFMVTWLAVKDGWPSILARVFSTDGTPTTDPLIVEHKDNCGEPNVGCVADDNFFIGWRNCDKRGYNVVGRIFSPNGVAVTNKFDIFDIKATIGGKSNPPFILGLKNGDAFVTLTWDDQKVLGQFFSPLGVPRANEFAINDNTKLPMGTAVSAQLTNGDIMVVYTYSYPQNYFSLSSIGHIIRNGALFGNEFSIPMNRRFPTIAAMANDNVLVVSLGAGHVIDSNSISGIILSSDGTPQTNPFDISLEMLNNVPVATSLSNGDAFVHWESSPIDNSPLPFGELPMTGVRTSGSGHYGRRVSLNNSTSTFTVNQKLKSKLGSHLHKKNPPSEKIEI